jgi:hypothetical protein
VTQPDDIVPKKIFTPRRRRSILSFRRKSDMIWFLLTLTLFISGVTAFVLTFLQFKPAEWPEESAGIPLATAVPVTPAAPAADAPAPLPAPPLPEPAPLTPVVESKPEPVKPPPRPAPTAVRAVPVESALLPLKEGVLLRSITDKNARVTATLVRRANGQPALTIDYDLRGGDWVQVYADVTEDLSRYGRVGFAFRGEGANDTLEFKIVDRDGSNFGLAWPRQTGLGRWTSVDLPLSGLKYLWGGDSHMDWRAVRQVYFAVSRGAGETAGRGRVIVRDFQFAK